MVDVKEFFVYLKKLMLWGGVTALTALAACGGGKGDDEDAQAVPPPPEHLYNYEVRRDLSVKKLLSGYQPEFHKYAQTDPDPFPTCQYSWLLTTDGKLYATYSRGTGPAGKLEPNCAKRVKSVFRLGKVAENVPDDGALHEVMSGVKNISAHYHAFTVGTSEPQNVYILRQDGVLLGIGDNSSGQLGRDPRQFPVISDFVEVARDVEDYAFSDDATEFAVFMLRRDGKVYVSGEGYHLNGMDGYRVHLADTGAQGVTKLVALKGSKDNRVLFLRNNGDLTYIYSDLDSGLKVRGQSFAVVAPGVRDVTSTSYEFANDTVRLYENPLAGASADRLVTNAIAGQVYSNGCLAVMRPDRSVDILGVAGRNYCQGSGESRPQPDKKVVPAATRLYGTNYHLFVTDDKNTTLFWGDYPIGVDRASALQERYVPLAGDPSSLKGRLVSFDFKPLPWRVARPK